MVYAMGTPETRRPGMDSGLPESAPDRSEKFIKAKIEILERPDAVGQYDLVHSKRRLRRP